MSPRWERIDHPPPEPAGRYLMDAVLTPNRALSRTAFAALLAVFVAVNVAIAALFAAQGAYPVLAFLGLDVLLFWLAFKLNFRDGRAAERVQVAADRVQVTRKPVSGRAESWVVSPHWARVEQKRDAVRIAAGDRFVAVGAFLSPKEREDFAQALAAAIADARRG